ncbi:complement decay-accelerating factor, GPI-anchored [Zootoca vivipara]|uniref:complement decay-accelerating factor, GPI-anchored n=1 Tax=Zootoca vivipara TaxID=8524 RepID=UPI00293B9BC4|nr:complement decay-accelerating factor, GPI-anchored [Zootoca vivipara]
MLVLIFLLGRRCPTIDLANGRIVKSNDLRLGDEITLGCDEGHRMVGEKTLRCRLIQNKVDWDKELPLCQRVPCFPPPKIANGQHSTTSDGEYSYGTSVTYTCDPYHSLIGNRTITCLVAADGVTGEWRPAAPEYSATISPVRSTKKPTSSTRPTNKPLPTPAGDPDSDNTPAIIIGFVLACLVVPCLVTAFWKYRSSMKNRGPEAPSRPAQFDKSVSKSGLEPKGSQLNKVSSVQL